MSILTDISGLYSKINTYITVGLLAGFVGMTVMWYTTSLRLDTAKQAIKTEQEARRADQESYKAAQALAAKKATEAKMKQEKIDRENAEKADASYRDLLSKYNASLLRFAQSQRQTLGSNLPGTSGAPKGSNRPSASSDVSADTVTIPFSDAQICAVNTARLIALHDWSLNLEKDNASKEGVVPKDDQ